MPSTSKLIEDIRSTVTSASLNFDIWWGLKNKNRAAFAQTMNTYPLFFATSIHAHFVALIIALYKLFETRSDTSNFGNLIKQATASKPIQPDTLKKIQATQSDAKRLWKKVCILRHEVFAHANADKSPDEIFQNANITPNELGKLVSLSKYLINTITYELTETTHAFNLSATDETVSLLKTLEQARTKRNATPLSDTRAE